jgi:hypothetical protein
MSEIFTAEKANQHATPKGKLHPFLSQSLPKLPVMAFYATIAG